MSKGSNNVWQRFAKKESTDTKPEKDKETTPKAKDEKPADKKPESPKPSEKMDGPTDEPANEPLNMTGKHLIDLLREVLPPEIVDALDSVSSDDDMIDGVADGHDGSKVVIVRRVNQSPFDAVSDDDFAPDPVVDMFKNQGGCNIVRAALKEGTNLSLGWLNSLTNDLTQVREAAHNAALRTVFACVHSAKKNKEVTHQIQALKMIDWLIRDASTEADLSNFKSAKRSILAGTDSDFDAASFRIRSVFASRIPQTNMVRTAYTALSTQEGEAYQLCPKAQFQIGRSVPMEISKCRDNCIDSRVTREGKVACAYADWMRVADNMHSAMGRLETVKHSLNDETSMNIKEGERGGLKEPESHETRLDKDRKGLTIDQSYEAALDSKDAKTYRHKNEKGEVRLQDEKRKEKELDHVELRIEDDHSEDEDNDEILDQLLEEARNSMDDADLDACAEELISKLHKNKP